MHRSLLVPLTILTLAASTPALAQDAAPKPEQHVPDDSNIPGPPPPEVGNKSAGGPDLHLHLPWSFDPSPEWTQDRGFPGTRFWRLDPGSVELEGWYQAKVHRPKAGGPGSNGTEHLLQLEVEVGILPGVQMDVYENAIKSPGERLAQEGNQIEFRIAPWSYGTVPLNPTLYLEWHPGHDRTDRWEVRFLIGGSPVEHLFLAANTISEFETGGERIIEWGVTGAAAYEVLPGVLRIGAETRITWEFSQHHQSPTDGFDGEVGPNFLFRPLALLRPEWGHFLKISFTSFFGINTDRASEFARVILVIGSEL